jgi:hypothetical protein
MKRLWSRLVTAVGVLVPAMTGVAALAAPAVAAPSAQLTPPTCSTRPVSFGTVEGSCVNASALYGYRITIFCIFNPASGGFPDYGVRSAWHVTTQNMLVTCNMGGFVWGTPEIEVRLQAPVKG